MANLIESNYFKAHYNYKTEANGTLQTVPLWGYESKDKLYDVVEFMGKWYCRVNNGSWGTEFNPIHRAIATHFKLNIGV